MGIIKLAHCYRAGLSQAIFQSLLFTAIAIEEGVSQIAEPQISKYGFVPDYSHALFTD